MSFPVFGACIYTFKNGPDAGKLCGAEFLRAHPGQVVCPIHAMARRIELQRQRTALARQAKRVGITITHDRMKPHVLLSDQ